MPDRYLDFVNSKLGRDVAGRLGLPRPAELRRYQLGDPLVDGAVLVGGLPGADLGGLMALLDRAAADVQPLTEDADRIGAIVFDATPAAAISDLAVLREAFAATLRRLRRSARVILIGRTPAGADPVVDATRQALDGIVRSLAKELRAGATANLILIDDPAVADDPAEPSRGAGWLVAAESPLRFLLSGRSAYVDGQVITVRPGSIPAVADWQQPLAGKVAVVTGAARGIGAAIATVLARDGAQVIAADLPAAGQALAGVANRINGTSLQLDIAAPDADQRLIEHLQQRHGGVDIVVHNAGITRDKLLANMKPAQWDSVLAVNLAAQLRINASLLDTGTLREDGRVVGLASTSGIAGNRGQTNYAASKAGVIGMVRSYALAFAARRATINAVAPGFIDTDMTQAMPLATRQVARRLNSLQQAGLPVDVAEAVGWFSWPGTAAVTGQVLRVCGQNLVGA